MRTIYKYELSCHNRDYHPHEELSMPAGARLLHAATLPVPGAGREFPEFAAFLWAEVVPTAPRAIRHLYAVGTGRTVPEGASYLVTITEPSGYVWHL